MSVWDWVHDYEHRAYHNGDVRRLQLIALYYQSLDYYEIDPDQEIALLKQGRDLAEELGDAWMLAFFDHWTIQALFSKGDYAQALDLAVRATVEARSPQVDGCPQRVCLHEDLIKIYLTIDPVGNAPRVAGALTYMEQQIAPDYECRFCLKSKQIGFALDMDQPAKAEELALRYLGDAENEPHYLTQAYLFLCEIAYRRADWGALGKWAALAEETARKIERKLDLIEALAWQALILQHQDHPVQAAQYATLATALAGRISAKLPGAYYNALCDYWELCGQATTALQLRDQQLERLLAGAGAHAICECRLKRCALLKRMGHPALNDELAAAREAAQKLIDPSRFLAKLEALA